MLRMFSEEFTGFDADLFVRGFIISKCTYTNVELEYYILKAHGMFESMF